MEIVWLSHVHMIHGDEDGGVGGGGDTSLATFSQYGGTCVLISIIFRTNQHC